MTYATIGVVTGANKGIGLAIGTPLTPPIPDPVIGAQN